MVTAEYKKSAIEFQNIVEKLGQTQKMVETMQRERSAWEEQLGQKYEQAFKERLDEMQRQYAGRPPTEITMPAAEHVQDETEEQMVEQLLQYEREFEQLREVAQQQVWWCAIIRLATDNPATATSKCEDASVV
jgi:hypothetical protein